MLLLSPIEALITALRKKVVYRKRYNHPVWYAGYILGSLLITLCALVFLDLLLSIERINDNRMDPTFSKGEYVLINHYPHRPHEGDVVCFHTNRRKSIGRIIASDNAKIAVSEGRFSIDGYVLPLGVFSDQELARYGLVNREDIYFEALGTRTYSISLPNQKIKKPLIKNPTISMQKNNFCIAGDNRKSEKVYEVIDRSTICGRIEGIMYSAHVKRLFEKPYCK